MCIRDRSLIEVPFASFLLKSIDALFLRNFLTFPGPDKWAAAKIPDSEMYRSPKKIFEYFFISRHNIHLFLLTFIRKTFS